MNAQIVQIIALMGPAYEIVWWAMGMDPLQRQHPDDPRAMRAPCKASEIISLLDDDPRSSDPGSSGSKLQLEDAIAGKKYSAQ